MAEARFCPKCGYGNPVTRGACLMCYSPVEAPGGGRQCPHCGGEVSPKWRFCVSCGGAVEEGARAVPGELALAAVVNDSSGAAGLVGGTGAAYDQYGQEVAAHGEEAQPEAGFEPYAEVPAYAAPAAEAAPAEEAYLPPPPAWAPAEGAEPADEFAPPPPPPAEDFAPPPPPPGDSDYFAPPPPPAPEPADGPAAPPAADFGWELEISEPSDDDDDMSAPPPA